jgi:outer membrane protein TolC
VEASLVEAINNLGNAAAYFNFLLNRPLETPLIIDSSLVAGPTYADATLPPSNPPAIAELPAAREELAQLKSTQRVMETNLRWKRAYILPHLNAFYDIGFQGFGFHFNGNQFYQMGGVQLQWSLFRGGDNKYKIRQAAIDIEAVHDQYLDLGRQLTLQVQTSLNNYRSAHRFTEKRFNEGQALQIELIDARTRMTEAELRYSLGRLAILNRAADLERVTASYRF